MGKALNSCIGYSDSDGFDLMPVAYSDSDWEGKLTPYW